MADHDFETLQPQILWKHFLDLKDIARPSKQEQQVLQHLRNWATQHGYEMRNDKIGNLCVCVPATSGREDASVVILQNHVDIVAANDENAPNDADAARGRIPIQRGRVNESGQFEQSGEGDWIGAPWTTLGADNGIGCAAAMAVCEMQGVSHPPLELLFTVDEEEGMSGALQLEPEMLELRGRTLLNLDTEADDELTIGSAGGCDVQVLWQAPLEEGGDWTRCEIGLSDLRGGHSGVEINSGRANAIRLLATALSNAANSLSIRVAAFRGGDRRNAIPRSCQATILVQAAEIDPMMESLTESTRVFNEQFAGRDNRIGIQAQATANNATANNATANNATANNATANNATDTQAFSTRDSRRLLDLLVAIPDGVFGMTAEIPDLPETSNNLALIATEGPAVTIQCSCRSSYDPGMRDILATFHAVGRLAGAEIREGNSYPGWKPNLQSPLLASARAVYERLFNEKPKVLAVHAGLECGVLASAIPGLDCISFGPNIRGNHAPGEHVQISSVQKSFLLLAEILKEA